MVKLNEIKKNLEDILKYLNINFDYRNINKFSIDDVKNKLIELQQIVENKKRIFDRNLNEIANFVTKIEIDDYFKKYLKTNKLYEKTKFHSRKRLFDFYFKIVDNSTNESKFERFLRNLKNFVNSTTYDYDGYFIRGTQGRAINNINRLEEIYNRRIRILENKIDFNNINNKTFLSENNKRIILELCRVNKAVAEVYAKLYDKLSPNRMGSKSINTYDKIKTNLSHNRDIGYIQSHNCNLKYQYKFIDLK